MSEEPKPIINPWVIVHQPEDGGEIQTLIFKAEGRDYQQYGLLIADIVRHVARACDVAEDAVREWVQKEMNRPTTKLQGGTLQ